MHGEVFKLWATEFGQVELTVSQVLQGASKQLRDLFLNVAKDKNPRCINAHRLGHWFASIIGKSAEGWRLERRVVHKQAAWRIVEAPITPSASDLDPGLSSEEVLAATIHRAQIEVVAAMRSQDLEAQRTARARLAEVMSVAAMVKAAKGVERRLNGYPEVNARAQRIDGLLRHLEMLNSVAIPCFREWAASRFCPPPDDPVWAGPWATGSMPQKIWDHIYAAVDAGAWAAWDDKHGFVRTEPGCVGKWRRPPSPITLLEEPPRQAGFSEFHRLKEGIVQEGLKC